MLRVLDMVEVHVVLARAGPRRGAARLRAVLGDLSDPTLTRSELEERFLALCGRADLAQPAVNAWVQTRDGAVQVDFLWRGEKLVVETDGRAFHATAAAYGRDRRRVTAH